MKQKTLKLSTIALAGVAVFANSAQAGGWIADNIIKPIAGERVAREADKLHEQLGKPGDQLVAATKDAVKGAAVPLVSGLFSSYY